MRLGMVTGDSPAGARRRVRLAIREARDAQHLTQAQVAEEMEWSLSKVMRIESGEVTITPNDLRPLLAFLRVTDQTVIDRLVQDVRGHLATRKRAKGGRTKGPEPDFAAYRAWAAESYGGLSLLGLGGGSILLVALLVVGGTGFALGRVGARREQLRKGADR